MLNDTDSWPVTCFECGEKTSIEISQLKKRSEFTCPRCGRSFEFLAKAFVNTLEQLRATVRFLRGNTRLLKEKDPLPAENQTGA